MCQRAKNYAPYKSAIHTNHAHCCKRPKVFCVAGELLPIGRKMVDDTLDRGVQRLNGDQAKNRTSRMQYSIQVAPANASTVPQTGNAKAIWRNAVSCHNRRTPLNEYLVAAKRCAMPVIRSGFGRGVLAAFVKISNFLLHMGCV